MKKLGVTLILFVIVSVIACTLMDLSPIINALDAYNKNYVKIMSFNIQHDMDNWLWTRKSLVTYAIIRENPDIIGLQEAYISQLEQLVDELPEYAYVGRGRNADGSGESVSIMYRKDRFELKDSGTFWFSDTPDVPGSKSGTNWGNPTHIRICSWARLVNKATGHGLFVFNVHLQSNYGTDPELARVKSVLLLTERINNREPKDPFVITGDFNSTPNEVPIRYLTDATTKSILYCPENGVSDCHLLENPIDIIDAWDSIHPYLNIGTRCKTGNTTDRRIDYIFTGKEGIVTNAIVYEKVQGSCPSDHLPITSSLLLPLGGGQQPP
jgi:endonuclease/exonuclease/phosphatase family metal-dependent hydrolase